jgi:DNA-binding IclR family transcriptional regulator
MTDGATELVDEGRGGAAGGRRRGIDRVIMLLEALLRHRAPMRVGDIARAIEAPRSTTYEIVNSLLDAGMLEPVGAEGHVYFGRAMHLFGWAYSHHNAHYRRIIETLDRLAAETGEMAQVCGLRGNKYLVLDWRASPGPFRIASDVGVEVPIPWTASGRLLLSHMSEAEVRAFIPPEDYRLPDGRMLAEADFLADIARARQQDYCETAGLADRFTWCMAAPVRDSRGVMVMTLCLVLPVDVAPDRRVELLALLRERARSVSLSEGDGAAT